MTQTSNLQHIKDAMRMWNNGYGDLTNVELVICLDSINVVLAVVEGMETDGIVTRYFLDVRDKLIEEQKSRTPA